LEKIRDFLSGPIAEEYEDEIDIPEEEPIRDINVTPISNGRGKSWTSKDNLINFNGPIEPRVPIIRSAPKSFQDAPFLCDCVKNKKIVLVDLADIEHDEAQRIMDFVSGAVYSMEGSIDRCGTNVYVVGHKNTDISLAGSHRDEMKNNAFGGPLGWLANVSNK